MANFDAAFYKLTSSTRRSRTSWSSTRPTTDRATRAGPRRRLPTDRPVDGITDLMIDGDIFVAENGAVARVIPASRLVAEAPDDTQLRPDQRLHDAVVADPRQRQSQPPRRRPVRVRRRQRTGSWPSTSRTASTSGSTSSRAATRRGRTSTASTCCRSPIADAPSTIVVDLEQRPQQRAARGGPRGVAAASPAPSPTKAAPAKTPSPRRSLGADEQRSAVIPLRDANPTRRTPVVTLGPDRRSAARRSRGSWVAGAQRATPASASSSTVHGARAGRADGVGPSGRLAVAAGARDRRPACSCTAAGSTCSATCSSCGSSATTSRTGWAGSAFLAFYLVGGVAAAPTQVADRPDLGRPR